MSEQKEQALLAELRSYSHIAVAYSGGVDSTYLAACAHEALGENALMIIADSPSIPRSELAEAKAMAEERGWNLRVIQTEEHHNRDYLANEGMRCFHCKDELFSRMRAALAGCDETVLAHGAIEDDHDDIRPGMQAAANHNVIAPLQKVGLYKEEIRQLSAKRGLPTAEKASFACLGSRFPTGTPIKTETMQQVETAEELLRTRGYRQYRVRHHGNLCRLEIDPADFQKLIAEREELIQALQATGYRFVTLDLNGYSTGSTA